MNNLSKQHDSTAGNIKNVAIKVAPNSFASTCCKILIQAYNKMLQDNNYNLSWEEDTFSANLKKEMDQICNNLEIPYSIYFQDPQLTDNILMGKTRAQTAKKIDIVFGTFYKPKPIRFGMEAKIMAQNNTATRNANVLCKEYIVSGIDRYISGDYAIQGCMVGYIINGNADRIVQKVNDVFTSSERHAELIKDKHILHNYPFCYKSSHGEITLQHFLFHFS